MRLFGSISKLQQLLFKKDTFDVTLKPSTAVTYTANRTVELPATDGNITLASSSDLSGKVTGPASATDNAIVRYDATTGKLVQDSSVIISDANAVSGVTQLDVDNIRIDGNTVSATDTNGSLILTPNGAGALVALAAGTTAHGTNAVDLQMSRSGDDYVAAAPRSAIIGGGDNQVDVNSATSVIAGGFFNTIKSTQQSAILAGTTNYMESAITSYGAVIAGGSGNTMTASGSKHINYSSILGGADHLIDATAAGSNSTVGSYNVISGGDSNELVNTSHSFIGSGQLNGIQKNNRFASILGGYNNDIDHNSASSVEGIIILGGNANKVTAAAERAIILNGTNNTIAHTISDSIVGGAGVSTGSWGTGSFILGNNTASSSVNNVYFRIEGGTGDIHVGRSTDQAAVSGQTNTLYIHTIEASNQSKYIALKTPDSGITSYTMTLPAAAGSSGQVLSTSGSGTLVWSTPVIPSGSGDFVLTSATQQLINKDIDGGTASDTNRFTIPKAAKATLDALTRKEGTIVYATDEGKSYIDSGSALVPVGSGDGAGGINAFLNPNAATNLTDISATGAGMTVVRTTTTSELPLYPLIETGIKITNVSGTTDTVDLDFVMPPAMMNGKRLLRVQQLIESGYGTADTIIDLKSYTDSGRTTSEKIYSLSTDDTSGDSYVPAFTGQYRTAFDADDRTYYRISYKRAAGTKYVVLQNVEITTDGVVSGAVIEQPILDATFAPAAGFGIVTLPKVYRQRVGNKMKVDGYWKNGTATASSAQLDLPSGYTIDYSFATTTSQVWVVGQWVRSRTGGSSNISSTDDHGPIFIDGSDTNSVYFGLNTSSNLIAKKNVTDFCSTSDGVSISFEIPIAEWAGSGTVNLGQNDVEYAANSDTWDGAGSTTVYGPSGRQMSGALTSARDKVITWKTPIQATDEIKVELSYNGVYWFDAANNTPYTLDSTAADAASAGIYIQANTATTTTVRFCRYANIANDDSPAGNWSTSYYWRVKKHASGQPVPFGSATATSAGLVSTTTQTFAGIKNNASMPAFRVEATVGQSFSTAAQVAFTEGNANCFDQGSCFASNTFTCPTGGDGVYQFHFVYNFDTSVSAGTLNGQIFKNSTQIATTKEANGSTTGGGSTVSVIVQLAAGDTVICKCAASSGTQTLSSGTEVVFSGAKLF